MITTTDAATAAQSAPWTEQLHEGRKADQTMLEEMAAAITQTTSDVVDVVSRMQKERDVRFCYWTGQSRDQRQWDRRLGQGKAFPWDGAADSKVFYADGLVGEQVRVMMAGWRRSRLNVRAFRSTNFGYAGKLQTLADWLFKNHLERELSREVELAAQWRQMHGLSVLGVYWHQEQRLRMDKLDFRELSEMAMMQARETGDDSGLRVLETLVDPLREEQAIAELRRQWPLMSQGRARKAVREFREKGMTEVPAVDVISDKPCWEALLPWRDVFFPYETRCLQKARWVARRQWMHESEVRNMVKASGWDEAWADEALTKKGITLDSLLLQEFDVSQGGTIIPQRENEVEVWWFYRQAVDEATGLPVVKLTIFSPSVASDPAWDGILGYEHGQLPFVECVRERIDGPLRESRGVATVAEGWQREMKSQRDHKINSAALKILPPIFVPMRLAKTAIDRAPGAQVPQVQQGEISPFNLGGAASDAAVVEDAVEREADRYFGRLSSEKIPEPAKELAVQDLASGFLSELGEAAKQTLQLCQQYMEPMTVQRVMGASEKSFTVSRDEIRGQFDLQILFDARDLNTEAVIKKAQLYRDFVLTADQAGVMDRSKFVKFMARAIDPDLADELVTEPDAAAEMEIASEKQNFALMESGIEPPMQAEGQNYELRLQTLFQLTQQPNIQQRLAQKPDTQAMVENRMKHLQFGMQQQKNAQTGRVGAERVTPMLPVEEQVTGQALAMR